MRLIVAGDLGNEEVIAEQIEIPGVDEAFAVHRSIGSHPQGAWSMSHVATGFSIGHGATLEEAVAAGSKAWLDATPAQRLEAKARAVAIMQAREIQSGSL